jgi:hypothetical protein
MSEHVNASGTFYVATCHNAGDARRIVACVNACEGIADPGAVPDLIAALAAAVQYLEKHRPKGNIRDIFSELNEYENGVMKPARAAIHRATGEKEGK